MENKNITFDELKQFFQNWISAIPDGEIITLNCANFFVTDAVDCIKKNIEVIENFDAKLRAKSHHCHSRKRNLMEMKTAIENEHFDISERRKNLLKQRDSFLK
jgi:hypothetical protein